MKIRRRTLLCLLLTAVLLVGFARAAAPAETYVYSPQLYPIEKRFYDEIGQAQNRAALRSGDPITLGPVSGTYASNEELDAQMDAYMDAVLNAATVYQREHPELFWLRGSRVDASFSVDGSSYVLKMKVNIFIADDWKNGGRSIDRDEQTLRSAVQSLAAAAREQGGCYAQLLYVHDWLTQHNVYNEAAASCIDGSCGVLPWSPLSALTDEDQPVCEGYARAFKLVCDELEIPCILVDGYAEGEAHMWNCVLLGGNWYAVDVTWDDPAVIGIGSAVSGLERRSYFLVGANTPVSGRTTFSQTHLPQTVWLDDRELAFPGLASEACPSNIADELPGPFSDVRQDDYFADAVIWAKSAGVTDGTSETTFSPADTVLRGQAVTFLWRAMGKPEPKTQSNPFTDVSASDYFYKAVLWAVENGITDGTSETTFSPNEPVTRGQMITFLWRTLGRPGETGSGPWYADAENWGNLNGYLRGTAEGYSTAARCPRSDVVYYLWQAAA